MKKRPKKVKVPKVKKPESLSMRDVIIKNLRDAMGLQR